MLKPFVSHRLKTWLSDRTACVILIDKEFNFLKSEGTKTGNVCRPITKCGGDNGGQDTIKDKCDSNEKAVQATWDVAGRSNLKVASNKSIVGVGSKGVIRGKGLSIGGGASNIIIQNIHLTEINPRFVWGGDALSIDGANNIWIDHCKFSLTGRQFLVSGFNPSGKVTISNSEFDGKTSWSTQCNGKHNWGVMLVGSNEQYTFANNYLHDLSSRGPKLGTTVPTGTNKHFFHGYNNLFKDVSGHSFDIDTNTDILLEGNFFQTVNTPITAASGTRGGAIYDVPDASSRTACKAQIGRDCVENAASGSGTLLSLKNTRVLTTAASSKDFLGVPQAVSKVAAYVQANAGIGRI